MYGAQSTSKSEEEAKEPGKIEEGKDYENKEGKLPSGGNYKELSVESPHDPERVVVVDELEIYASRDHYEDFKYAGKVEF